MLSFVCVISLAWSKCSFQSFSSQNAWQVTGSASSAAYRALLEARALEPEKRVWLGEDFLMSIVQLYRGPVLWVRAVILPPELESVPSALPSKVYRVLGLLSSLQCRRHPAADCLPQDRAITYDPSTRWYTRVPEIQQKPLPSIRS